MRHRQLLGHLPGATCLPIVVQTSPGVGSAADCGGTPAPAVLAKGSMRVSSSPWQLPYGPLRPLGRRGLQ